MLLPATEKEKWPSVLKDGDWYVSIWGDEVEWRGDEWVNRRTGRMYNCGERPMPEPVRDPLEHLARWEALRSNA
jgi:hypothetical protein